MASAVSVSLMGDMCCCTICKEVYTDPRVLHCGHTFCFQCIATWFKKKGHQLQVSCPVCRDVTPVPNNDVSALSKNFEINDIVHMLQNARGKPVCDICDVVKQVAVTAKHKCEQCNKYMCDDCTVKHDQNSVFQDHTVRAAEQVMCKKHSKEELVYYCEECNVLLCTLCVTDNLHSSHKVGKLTDICDKYKQELREIMDRPQAKKIKVITTTELKHLQNVKAEIESVTQKVKLRAAHVTQITKDWGKKNIQMLKSEKEGLEKVQEEATNEKDLMESIEKLILSPHLLSARLSVISQSKK